MGNIYAEPRLIEDLSECQFYHTMDVPGWGRVDGVWDLRGGEDEYLGRVDFGAKRVLEIGPADGFLSFLMEKRGASVVSYDLTEKHDWDFVPFERREHRLGAEFQANLRKLNNAYWLCHRAFDSKGQVVYGTAYDIPEEIGPVDVTTFGSVLLHLRDPFLALQRALRLTRETVVVTDLFGEPRPGRYERPAARRVRRARKRVRDKLLGASMLFLPDARTGESNAMWWYLTPAVVRRFLAVLGFEESRVTFHEQLYLGAGRPIWVDMYTVVARRTYGFEPPPESADGASQNPEPAGKMAGTV